MADRFVFLYSQQTNHDNHYADLYDYAQVVVEYCFHGNLKDYVSRYREYFIDELCPDTKVSLISCSSIIFI